MSRTVTPAGEPVFGERSDRCCLALRGGRLTVSPRLPAALRLCRVVWTDFSGVRHEIELTHGGVTVDGERYTGGEIG